MKSELTTKDMEKALYGHFRGSSQVICPRTMPGFGFYEGKKYVKISKHECDLLIVTKSGYLKEVEIKISLEDLKAEKRKSHKHESEWASLYFAIPEDLFEKAVSYIPDEAGILTIDKNLTVINKRNPSGSRKIMRKVPDGAIKKLFYLVYVKYWERL